MTSLKSIFQHHLGTLILLLFAGLSLALVIEARDPAGFMGWVFCLAFVLVMGPGPAEQDFS